MSKLIQLGALLAALSSIVSGHTYVEFFEMGGVKWPGYRKPSSGKNSPVDPGNDSPAWWTDQGEGYQPVYGDQLNHPVMIAHINATSSPYTKPAPAGSQVTFHWRRTGTCGAQGDEAETGWDCSHHGWTATYLAPCPADCKDVDKTQLKFFKIHESALIDYRAGRWSKDTPGEWTGYWGTDDIFYKNGNKQTVTIPSNIPSGNYVLRTEVMSKHNNGPDDSQTISSTQFWPQACNIQVTGGKGAKVPADGRTIQELYSKSDEKVTWNLYKHTPNKVWTAAPGPKLLTSANARRSHARTFSI